MCPGLDDPAKKRFDDAWDYQRRERPRRSFPRPRPEPGNPYPAAVIAGTSAPARTPWPHATQLDNSRSGVGGATIRGWISRRRLGLAMSMHAGFQEGCRREVAPRPPSRRHGEYLPTPGGGQGYGRHGRPKSSILGHVDGDKLDRLGRAAWRRAAVFSSAEPASKDRHPGPHPASRAPPPADDRGTRRPRVHRGPVSRWGHVDRQPCAPAS